VKPEIGALLSGYSAGILTKEERQELFRAALEDQEVYDALASEQPLRTLLEQPAVRRELLEALERRGWGERLTGWLASSRPMLAGVTAVFVTAVAAFFLLRQSPPPSMPQPTGSPWSPGGGTAWPGMFPIDRRHQRRERVDLLRRLFSLPLRQPFAVQLSLDRPGQTPRYQVGQAMRITFEVERESDVLILEKRPDGAVMEIFPAGPNVLSRLPAGVAQSVPPASLPPLPVTGPEGRRSLRLIAVPSGVDLDRLTPGQLQSLKPQLAVAEATYDVGPSSQ
jgi:hypothetical protein